MKKSVKTTTAGGVAGFALVSSALERMIVEGFSMAALLQIVSAVALVVLGLVSRDDDVTSEGEKAPKMKGFKL